MSNTPDNNRPDCERSSQESKQFLLEVEINVDAKLNLSVDTQRLREAVMAAARYRKFCEGKIGVRVTDDVTIQAVNRKHLQHDYPTDVISFAYENKTPFVEGEMVVSIDTAGDKAREIGWSPENELLLYVVHGTLHICGMDDVDPGERAEMRKAEHDILLGLGIADIVQFAADGQMSLASQRGREELA